ncbi:hypothetical protein [Pseudooceanicola sp. HF7]|uniref:hypothetical protein n=1 Tax=Pseudooceanicola sp. HF7 TaxID=2721560 RepID=UPI0014321A17|nr:hypothetical protein [Pseudooceanicola sp. HF7]NIZ10238.1 hypothetical protein [Pseudooceanicola sp. HF7]
MARNRWHRLEEGGAVTVTRALPVRFDLEAKVRLAAPDRVSRTALAHQVRQDLWRLLQDTRGLSPAVQVRRDGPELEIIAGGRLAHGRVTAHDRRRAQALLDDPERRARWLAHAGRRADV